MQRISVDFTLYHNEGDVWVVPVGADTDYNLRDVTLREGERATFYEEGSLEADGVLQARRSPDGRRYWYAILDPAPLRYLSEASAAATP